MGAGEGGEGEGRGGGERKAKVSEKLPGGESNFFLLSCSLSLSLRVARSPGQIIFRAFEIVGARAPPLASASRAQRRETPSRGGAEEGARAGAHRLRAQGRVAREDAVAAARESKMEPSPCARNCGRQVYSQAVPRVAAGAPRGLGLARAGASSAGSLPAVPMLPRPRPCPHPPAPPCLAPPRGREHRCPGDTARSRVLLSLSLRLGPSPGLRAQPAARPEFLPPAPRSEQPVRPPRLAAGSIGLDSGRPVAAGRGGAGGDRRPAARTARLPQHGRGPVTAKRRAQRGADFALLPLRPRVRPRVGRSGPRRGDPATTRPGRLRFLGRPILAQAAWPRGAQSRALQGEPRGHGAQAVFRRNSALSA